MRPRAKNALHQLRALRTDQTADAEDFALAQLERHVAEALGVDGREVLDGEHDLARNILALGIEVGQLTTDHSGNDHIGGQLFCFPGTDILTVAHDGHFVADAENFVHLVRDIDNRNALRLEIVHNPEQRLNLVLRQRRGRLVQNQNLAVCGDRLRDFHRLHLRHTQAAELRLRIKVHTHALEKRRRVLVHFFMIDRGDQTQHLLDRVAAQEDILSDGPRRNRLEFLMHHGNAHFQCFHGVMDGNFFAVKEDFAFVHLIDAEHALHECGFSRAVFSHEGVNRAGAEAELRMIQSLYAREGFAHPAHLQQKFRHTLNASIQ